MHSQCNFKAFLKSLWYIFAQPESTLEVSSEHLIRTLSILKIQLKHPWRFLEASLKHPWSKLEVSLKYPWSIPKAPLKIFEASLMHLWSNLEAPLKDSGSVFVGLYLIISFTKFPYYEWKVKLRKYRYQWTIDPFM